VRASCVGDTQSEKSTRVNEVEIMKTPSVNPHLEVEQAIWLHTQEG